MKLVQPLMKGLAKNPDEMWLEVGNRKLKAAAELLKGKKREDALARIAATAPRYGEYQKEDGPRDPSHPPDPGFVGAPGLTGSCNP
jgi:hypothetical protein